MKHLGQHFHKSVFKVVVLIPEHLVCIRSLYFLQTPKVVIFVFAAFLPIYFNWYLGNEASGSAFPQVGIQGSGIDSRASGVYKIFIFPSNSKSCDEMCDFCY
jgi:hypothetical protein